MNKKVAQATENLILEGRFSEALREVKTLDSLEEQVRVIFLPLFGYAVSAICQDREYEVIITTDRQEYERFRATVGVANDQRLMVYQDAETGMMDAESIYAVIKAALGEKNVMCQYLDTICSDTA